MERDEKQIYARHRLERSREDLAWAQESLANHWPRLAINRAYYACFHLASAVLFWHGEERVKHSGIRSAFGEFLVNPGRIEPEFGKILREAGRLREAQEYTVPEPAVTEEEVQRLMANAERFVARLEKYLREAGALGGS